MAVSAKSRRQAAPRPSAVPRQRDGSGLRVPAGVRARFWLASVRQQLGLDRGERMLATAVAPDDDYVLVATDRALYYREDAGWRRVGWEQVAGVAWDAKAGHLAITALSSLEGRAGSALARHRILVPLRERGNVADVALDRITHSRLGRWPVPLPGGKRVIAEARRRPVTGELSWIVTPDGTDPVGPADRTQLSAALDRLGAELGFGPQAARPGAAPPIPQR